MIRGVPPARPAKQRAPRVASSYTKIAARHIAARVPTGRVEERVRTARARLEAHAYDAVEVLFVLDAAGALLGAVPIAALLRADGDALLGDLLDARYPRVHPDAARELVAAEASLRGVTSVAITDHEGRLLGAVPARALLEILHHEHVEDLHRLAGITREVAGEGVGSALQEPPSRRARHRLPWLLVGLLGSMLTAFVVSTFDATLEANLAVAFFVPAIVYLADAIGTQTEAIVVRGLSLTRLSLRELFLGELRTGLLIGAVLGLLALPVVVVAFGDLRLAAAVAAAIAVAGTVATTIGLLLPWVLQRLGSDPALGSGPLATIIQDLLSLLIYFAIASLLLR